MRRRRAAGAGQSDFSFRAETWKSDLRSPPRDPEPLGGRRTVVVEAHDAARGDDVDPWNRALRQIFTFYAGGGHLHDERTMDLTQFYTFAKDVPNIVCGRISQGDLGVVFSAGQGLQCRLRYPQFLESLVWLAAKKFVNDEPHMAYCRLLTEHVFCVDCAPLNVRSDARSLFLARREERERGGGHGGGHGGQGGQGGGSRDYGGATADSRRQRLGHDSKESLRLDYSRHITYGDDRDHPRTSVQGPPEDEQPYQDRQRHAHVHSRSLPHSHSHSHSYSRSHSENQHQHSHQHQYDHPDEHHSRGYHQGPSHAEPPSFADPDPSFGDDSFGGGATPIRRPELKTPARPQPTFATRTPALRREVELPSSAPPVCGGLSGDGSVASALVEGPANATTAAIVSAPTAAFASPSIATLTSNEMTADPSANPHPCHVQIYQGIDEGLGRIDGIVGRNDATRTIRAFYHWRTCAAVDVAVAVAVGSACRATAARTLLHRVCVRQTSWHDKLSSYRYLDRWRRVTAATNGAGAGRSKRAAARLVLGGPHARWEARKRRNSFAMWRSATLQHRTVCSQQSQHLRFVVRRVRGRCLRTGLRRWRHSVAVQRHRESTVALQGHRVCCGVTILQKVVSVAAHTRLNAGWRTWLSYVRALRARATTLQRAVSVLEKILVVASHRQLGAGWRGWRSNVHALRVRTARDASRRIKLGRVLRRMNSTNAWRAVRAWQVCVWHEGSQEDSKAAGARALNSCVRHMEHCTLLRGWNGWRHWVGEERLLDEGRNSAVAALGRLGRLIRWRCLGLGWRTWVDSTRDSRQMNLAGLQMNLAVLRMVHARLGRALRSWASTARHVSAVARKKSHAANLMTRAVRRMTRTIAVRRMNSWTIAVRSLCYAGRQRTTAAQLLLLVVAQAFHRRLSRGMRTWIAWSCGREARRTGLRGLDRCVRRMNRRRQLGHALRKWSIASHIHAQLESTESTGVAAAARHHAALVVRGGCVKVISMWLHRGWLQWVIVVRDRRRHGSAVRQLHRVICRAQSRQVMRSVETWKRAVIQTQGAAALGVDTIDVKGGLEKQARVVLGRHVGVSLLKKATMEPFDTGLVTLCRVHRRSTQRALWRSWVTWVRWAAVETAGQQMRVDFAGLVSRQAGICRGFLAYLFVGAARQLLSAKSRRAWHTWQLHTRMHRDDEAAGVVAESRQVRRKVLLRSAIVRSAKWIVRRGLYRWAQSTLHNKYTEVRRTSGRSLDEASRTAQLQRRGYALTAMDQVVRRAIHRRMSHAWYILRVQSHYKARGRRIVRCALNRVANAYVSCAFRTWQVCVWYQGTQDNLKAAGARALNLCVRHMENHTLLRGINGWRHWVGEERLLDEGRNSAVAALGRLGRLVRWRSLNLGWRTWVGVLHSSNQRDAAARLMFRAMARVTMASMAHGFRSWALSTRALRTNELRRSASVKMMLRVVVGALNRCQSRGMRAWVARAHQQELREQTQSDLVSTNELRRSASAQAMLRVVERALYRCQSRGMRAWMVWAHQQELRERSLCGLDRCVRRMRHQRLGQSLGKWSLMVQIEAAETRVGAAALRHAALVVRGGCVKSLAVWLHRGWIQWVSVVHDSRFYGVAVRQMQRAVCRAQNRRVSRSFNAWRSMFAVLKLRGTYTLSLNNRDTEAALRHAVQTVGHRCLETTTLWLNQGWRKWTRATRVKRGRVAALWQLARVANQLRCRRLAKAMYTWHKAATVDRVHQNCVIRLAMSGNEQRNNLVSWGVKRLSTFWRHQEKVRCYEAWRKLCRNVAAKNARALRQASQQMMDGWSSPSTPTPTPTTPTTPIASGRPSSSRLRHPTTPPSPPSSPSSPPPASPFKLIQIPWSVKLMNKFGSHWERMALDRSWRKWQRYNLRRVTCTNGVRVLWYFAASALRTNLAAAMRTWKTSTAGSISRTNHESQFMRLVKRVVARTRRRILWRGWHMLRLRALKEAAGKVRRMARLDSDGEALGHSRQLAATVMVRTGSLVRCRAMAAAWRQWVLGLLTDTASYIARHSGVLVIQMTLARMAKSLLYRGFTTWKDRDGHIRSRRGGARVLRRVVIGASRSNLAVAMRTWQSSAAAATSIVLRRRRALQIVARVVARTRIRMLWFGWHTLRVRAGKFALLLTRAEAKVSLESGKQRELESYDREVAVRVVRLRGAGVRSLYMCLRHIELKSVARGWNTWKQVMREDRLLDEASYIANEQRTTAVHLMQHVVTRVLRQRLSRGMQMWIAWLQWREVKRAGLQSLDRCARRMRRLRSKLLRGWRQWVSVVRDWRAHGFAAQQMQNVVLHAQNRRVIRSFNAWRGSSDSAWRRATLILGHRWLTNVTVSQTKALHRWRSVTMIIRLRHVWNARLAATTSDDDGRKAVQMPWALARINMVARRIDDAALRRCWQRWQQRTLGVARHAARRRDAAWVLRNVATRAAYALIVRAMRVWCEFGHDRYVVVESISVSTSTSSLPSAVGSAPASASASSVGPQSPSVRDDLPSSGVEYEEAKSPSAAGVHALRRAVPVGSPWSVRVNLPSSGTEYEEPMSASPSLVRAHTFSRVLLRVANRQMELRALGRGFAKWRDMAVEDAIHNGRDALVPLNIVLRNAMLRWRRWNDELACREGGGIDPATAVTTMVTRSGPSKLALAGANGSFLLMCVLYVMQMHVDVREFSPS